MNNNFLKTLSTVVFGIFNILATAPYEWPPLIIILQWNLYDLLINLLIFRAFYFQLFIYVLGTETLIQITDIMYDISSCSLIIKSTGKTV